LFPDSRHSFHRSGLGLLVDLYGCHPRYHYADKRAGFLTATDTYLSLLAHTTPTAVAASLADRSLWDLGWWSSFAFIVPDSGHRDWREPTLGPEAPALLETLIRLFKKLPGSGESRRYRPSEVALDPGAAAAWSLYRRALVYDLRPPDLDARLRVAYCQLPLQLIKVATLLAALDWAAALPPDIAPAQPAVVPARGRAKAQKQAPPQPEPFLGLTITQAHLARAQSIVEAWRAGLHRALEAASVASTAGLDVRILRQVEAHGAAGATARDVYRGLADRTPMEVAARLNHLHTLGFVETVPAPAQPGPGRPTTHYRLPE